MSRGLTLEGLAAFEASKRRRRAERCIGLAIRKGQAEGRISQRGDQRSDQRRQKTLISPSVFLRPGDETVNTYAMTDDVPADTFEAAIEEAKAEPAGQGVLFDPVTASVTET